MFNYFSQQLVEQYDGNIANFGFFANIDIKEMIDKIIFFYLF